VQIHLEFFNLLIKLSFVCSIVSFVGYDLIEVSCDSLDASISHGVDKVENCFLNAMLILFDGFFCSHGHSSRNPISVQISSHIFDKGFLHVLEVEDLVINTELIIA